MSIVSPPSAVDVFADRAWEQFLALVLIALMLETFLANRLSPKQDEQELEHIAPGMRRLAKKGRGAV